MSDQITPHKAPPADPSIVANGLPTSALTSSFRRSLERCFLYFIGALSLVAAIYITGWVTDLFPQYRAVNLVFIPAFILTVLAGFRAYSYVKARWVTQVMLRERIVCHGALWWRKRTSFEKIHAIQILQIVPLKLRNVEKDSTWFEINLILEGADYSRLPFMSLQGREDARRIASALGQSLSAPVLEQVSLQN
jgi:hypothetical protein